MRLLGGSSVYVYVEESFQEEAMRLLFALFLATATPVARAQNEGKWRLLSASQVKK